MSTSGALWRELPYVGQEFKKLSAVPHFLWGIGGDHQVYVYVHGLDIPIRVREESFENEVCYTFICYLISKVFLNKVYFLENCLRVKLP